MSPTVVLLPRMDALAVQHALEELASASDKMAGLNALSGLQDNIIYAPVGGTPATAYQLSVLKEQIEEVARRCGFPNSGSGEKRAQFDAACGELLGTISVFQSGEALRDDVWAFIATALLPKVTHWRFGESPDRWHGGIRNTFQRLWIRARALDRGKGHRRRWELLQTLTEDALVALTERTAIAAQHRLALEIAEGWLRASERYGRTRMEPVMRRAVMSLRLRSEVTALTVLSPPVLSTIVDGAFKKAALSLGLTEVASSS